MKIENDDTQDRLNWQRDALRVTFVALAYFAAHWVAFQFPDAEQILAAIWPAGGIGLAALLLNRRRLWTPLLIGMFIAGNAANLLYGRPLFNSVGFMTANVFESLLCAWFIIRWCGNHVTFTRVQEILALIFSATVINAGTTFIGAGTATLAQVSTSFWDFWRTWWVGDGLGILIVAPLIVSWLRSRHSVFRTDWRRLLEAGIFFELWCGISWLAFETPNTHNLPFIPQPYVLVILLAYAAMRFNLRGTTSAVTFMSIILLISPSVTQKSLLWGGGSALDHLLQAQIFIASIAIAGYMLNSALAERTQAEEMLRVSSLQNTTILATTMDGFWLTDVKTQRLIEVNDAYCRMSGYSREELLQMDIAQLEMFERPTDITLHIERLRATGSDRFETIHRRKDGSALPLDISVQYLEKSGKSFAFLRDITERKHTEAELRQAEAKYHDIFENAAEGIFQSNLAGRFITVNLAMARIFGYASPEEMITAIGNNIATRIYANPAHRAAFIHELGRSGIVEGFEAENLRKDGSVIWTRTNARAITDASGAIQYYEGFLEDITERRQAEINLEVALENAHLRHKETLALLKAAQTIPLCKTFEESARQIFDICKDLIGAKSGYVALLSEDGTENEVLFLEAGGLPCEVDPNLPMPIRGLREVAYRTKASAYENDFANSTWVKFMPQGHVGLENVLFAPLNIGDKTVGLIGVANKPGGFNERDAHLAQAFGDLAAVALKYAEHQDQLRASEERYRTLVETADDVILLTDLQGKHLFRNSAYYTSLGFEVGEQIGPDGFARVHPEDVAQVRSKIGDLLQQGEAVSEYRIQHKDGRWLYRFAKSKLMRDAAGQPTSIFAIIRDITERKQAETALRESEERFHSMFEKHNAVMLLIESETGSILDANLAAQDYYGYSITALKQMSIQDINALTPAEVKQRRQQAAHKSLNFFVFPHRLASGEIRTVEVHSSPITVNDKLILFTIVHDITERQQAEEKLSASEASLREAQRLAHIGDWQWIAATDTVKWSEELYRINGRDPNLPPPTFAEMSACYTTESWARLSETVANAMQTGKAYELELDIARPDQTIRHTLARGAADYDANGAVIGLHGIVQDITERTDAESALRESEQKFRAVIDQTTEGVMMIDHQGTIVEWNHQQELGTGIMREQVLGKPIWELIYILGDTDSSSQDYLIQGMAQLQKPPEEIDWNALLGTNETVHTSPAGVVRYVEHHYFPVCIGRNVFWANASRDITERKQAEFQKEAMLKALREMTNELTKAKFELNFILENIPLGVTKIIDRKMVFTNRMMEKIFQYSREELEFQTTRKFYPSDVAYEKLGNEAYPVLAEDIVYETEQHLLTKTGKPIVVRFVGKALEPPDMSKGAIWIVEDITERKLAEEKLRASEETFRNIIELSPVPYAINDDQQNITYLNSAFIKTFGYDLKDIPMLAAWWVQAYPDADYRNWVARTWQTRLDAAKASGGEFEPLEVDICCKDGSIKSVLASAGWLGETLKRSHLVILYDITERKRTEQALRESEEKYRTVADFTYNWEAWHAPYGTYLYISPSCERITGYTAAEFLNDANLIIKVTHPDDQATVIEHFHAVADQAKLEDIQFDFRIITRGGETRWINHNCTAVYGENGKWLGRRESNLDITNRKRAEEKIRQLNDELEQRVEERTRELREAQEKIVQQERLAVLGQMAGGIGHELRNPLGVISNAVYFLKLAQPDAPDKVKEYLNLIQKNVNISDKIVSDLLDFTRIKSLDRHPASVIDLIHQTLERFPVPNKVQVKLDLPPNLPQAYADPQHVIQVLGNLTTNACQAMAAQSDGTLTIAASIHDAMVCIVVHDTGTGISPENMKKLFEPLFTTKPKGIGLGLAISKKLIEANGGRIEVVSEVGTGSTFKVYLPMQSHRD